MLIYLAGAIDKASVADYGFDELKNALLMAHARRHDIDEAIQLFIPARGWVISGRSTIKNAETLIGLNMKIVQNADIMVVRYDRGIETWGTPMEVQLARHNTEAPVYIWSVFEHHLGEKPEFVEAQDLLPTYLLPYAKDGKVWGDLELMAAGIMKEYAMSDLEKDAVLDPDTLLNFLREGLGS